MVASGGRSAAPVRAGGSIPSIIRDGGRSRPSALAGPGGVRSGAGNAGGLPAGLTRRPGGVAPGLAGGGSPFVRPLTSPGRLLPSAPPALRRVAGDYARNIGSRSSAFRVDRRAFAGAAAIGGGVFALDLGGSRFPFRALDPRRPLGFGNLLPVPPPPPGCIALGPGYGYGGFIGLPPPNSLIQFVVGVGRPDLIVTLDPYADFLPPPYPEEWIGLPPPPARILVEPPPPYFDDLPSQEDIVETFVRPRTQRRYEGPVLVADENSIQFDLNSATIKPKSFALLDRVGAAMLEPPLDTAILNVEGHTDSTGPDEFNQRLSEERALSVRSYLTQRFGIDPNRLIVVGYGSRAPIASNDGDDGRRRNRRVEFENVTDLYRGEGAKVSAEYSGPEAEAEGPVHEDEGTPARDPENAGEQGVAPTEDE